MMAEQPIINPYIYSSIIPIESDMFFGRAKGDTASFGDGFAAQSSIRVHRR